VIQSSEKQPLRKSNRRLTVETGHPSPRHRSASLLNEAARKGAHTPQLPNSPAALLDVAAAAGGNVLEQICDCRDEH
jgi:hypothetical protein